MLKRGVGGGGRHSARIGIIGAGAAGLTAAHDLARLGYRRVTVIEGAERVGGKCCTFHHEGRSYELGAAIVTRAYTTVRDLMRENGIRATPTLSGVYLDLATRKTRLVVPAVRGSRWLEVGPACARLAVETLRHEELLYPGHRDNPLEAARPFSEWAAARGLELAAKVVEPWITGFGYGYIHEVPAAYILKYARLFGPPLELLDGGYQGLWEAVARKIDVRLGARVRRVVRNGETAVVETDHERFTFDALILACPLDGALDFLDASPEERALFSRVVTNEYRVVAASVEGLSYKARYMFIPENIGPQAHGKVMFWYKRHKETDVFMFYAFAGDDAPMSETIANVKAFVEGLGGKISRVHRAQGVRYFPRVTAEDMANGYYGRLESLQGARRTYYTGELLNFSSVESAAAYSRALVEQRFGAEAFARA